MRTNEENADYQQRFQEEAIHNGLAADLSVLYQMERDSGNLKTAGAILSLFPGVDAYDRAIQHFHGMEEEKFRNKISDKLLATLKEVQPEHFSSWHDAKNYDLFLHAQDGSMLSKKQREEFLNFRQCIRIDWTQQVASEGEVRQESMLSQMKIEQQKQESFQNTMYDMMNYSHTAQTQAYEKLNKISEQQGQGFSSLNNASLSIQKMLSEQDVKIDEHTFLLLQSDEVLSMQITAVAKYLKTQDDLKKIQAFEQRAQQIKIADYKGVLDGFGLLSAIGQRTNNSTLEKIGVVGGQIVLIDKALSDLPSMLGFSALSPYAAIGMAVLNIASLFMKRGPDPSQIILKQIEQLSKQIQNMHRDMREQFTDMHHQINRLEHMIIRGFKQIGYLVMKPLSRNLDEIRGELDQLNRLVQIGFQDLLLKDLSKCLAHVNSFVDGITPNASQDKQEDWLITLADWVKKESYNRQLTGMTIFKEGGERQLSVSPRNVFSILQSANPDFCSVVNIFLVIAVQQGWSSTHISTLPHTGVWFQALAMYVELRTIYVNKLGNTYDPQFKELNQILEKIGENVESLTELTSSESIVKGHFQKVIQLYTTLLNQYESLSVMKPKNEPVVVSGPSISKPNRNQQLPPSKTGKKYIRMAEQSIKTDKSIKIAEESIPKNFSFEYVAGKNVHKRKGHQRDFSVENGFTQRDVLKLIGNTAAQKNLSLFDPVLLSAEKMGLIEFRCRMHRSMSDGGERKYKTEGKAYGLEIMLYVRETQERFLLTEATSGYAKWSSKDRHKTSKTMESHKKALAEKTRFNGDMIQNACVAVTTIVNRRIKESQEPFYQQVSHELLHDRSIANELLMYLQLGKMMQQFNCFQCHGFDYQQAIDQLSGLLRICKENPLNAESSINNFFKMLPDKILKIQNCTFKFLVKMGNFQPLQDLFQGKVLLQSRFTLFGSSSPVQLESAHGFKITNGH